MKQYSVKIKSKNKKSLKHFLNFFFKHLKKKFNIMQKPKIAITERNIITFLKSPHVNKTAQEHFERNVFVRKIPVKGSSLVKAFIFSKKIITKLFQDISINLEIVISELLNKKNSLPLFNPNIIKLFKKNYYQTNIRRYKQKNVFKNFTIKKNSFTHLIKLLSTTSVFGEIIILFY